MASGKCRIGDRMTALSSLSNADKVLIYLSRIRVDKNSEPVPKTISQEGIAEAVGISRSHVPRTVKSLIEDGLIEEAKRHVKLSEKRVKVYFVLPKGLKKAREIEERAMLRIVKAKIQNTIVEGMSLAQLEKAFHRRIDILKLSGEEDFIDLDAILTSGVTDFSDSPKVATFLDREDALEQMKNFLKSRALVLSIYGAKGIGTSSLAKHFIQMLDDWNIIWISLSKYKTVDEIRNRLESFSKLLHSDVEKILQTQTGGNVLIVFDGYFDVDERIVEFFNYLADRREGAKIIVTCRDSTPSYNRFYRKEHIEAGLVTEMTLKGLPEEESRILLGNEDIPDEALRRIFALSRGSPMILTMLRDGDEEGLRKNTTFTNEEIRFLLTEARTRKSRS
ncbi:MAG: NB-ARC domain-containing protein [Thermoplasmata archaeon]